MRFRERMAPAIYHLRDHPAGMQVVHAARKIAGQMPASGANIELVCSPGLPGQHVTSSCTLRASTEVSIITMSFRVCTQAPSKQNKKSVAVMGAHVNHLVRRWPECMSSSSLVLGLSGDRTPLTKQYTCVQPSRDLSDMVSEHDHMIGMHSMTDKAKVRGAACGGAFRRAMHVRHAGWKSFKRLRDHW